MQDSSLQDTIDALDDVLDQERVALLDGNLDLVGRLVVRKGALSDALTGDYPPNSELISALSIKANRNQILLGSALEGIQRVTDRLGTMRRIRTSLETYDAQGQRKRVEMRVKGKVEKRA